VTATPRAEPDFEGIINRVLEDTSLTASQRRSIVTALLGRVRTNLRRSEAVIDLREFERGVRVIAQQVASQPQTVPPSELSASQVGGLIDRLCAGRVRPPYPICPARD
jgi:hypothetical protein